MFRSLLLSVILSCCSAQDSPPPLLMRLNYALLPNQSQVVLTAGSTFTLSCHGDGLVHWSTTAFRLLYEDKLPNPLTVDRSHPRHTGTYRCGSTNHSLEHLHTWIHLYIKDLSDPSSVFVTPASIPRIKEGQDFLFRCLLTDPSVTNCSLRLVGDAGGRGRGLPRGMNVTFDPLRGVLIRKLQVSFRGRYVCSGWRDGRELTSQSVHLLVFRRMLPPSVYVSQEDFTRLEGEKFEVTCLTSNPNHFYNVTWTHPLIQTLDVFISRLYSNSRLYRNSTLSVAMVTRAHSGTYTCTAVSEDGVAMATTRLCVVDRPYLSIYLQRRVHTNAKANTQTMEDKGETLAVNVTLVANVTTDRMEGRANVSGTSRVEVHEGEDVTLTFVMEAYPPISYQHWTMATPTNSSYTAYKESYAANGYRSEASLLLHRVRQEDRGLYLLHYSSLYFSGSQEIDLRLYSSPIVVLYLKNDTLTCSGSGYPLPIMLWYICPGVMDTCGDGATYQVSPPDVTPGPEKEEKKLDEEDTTWKYLPLPPSTGDDVTVECVAYNRFGVSRDVFILYEPRRIFTSALIGALGSASVLFFLLLVVLYKWKQKPRYEIRWKIIESTDGNNYTFVDPTQLPYNHKWEFPRDKLRLGAVLGSGAFGKVVEATAYGLGTDNNVTRVAVKMLKPSAHSEEREALMSELKILSHLGYHDNIVNLLGACTQGGPMLMITEYCSHGDLLNFLRAHTQDFLAAILSVDTAEGQVFYKNMAAQHGRVRSDSGISCCSDDQEMQSLTNPGQKHLSVQTDSLSVGDLMMFSYQVAQGLDFLSTKNCIHRDVAARNILLTDCRVAKICDFGLARDICNDDSYIVQGNARLPVKWMAPESIFQCVYTVQSDVWSYGVLLWEIFSLGKSPYPNVAVDTNFYKMIQDGRHMDQPDYAPPKMYQLMIGCWSLEPTDRPTFKAIGQLIKRLLPSTNDTRPHHSDQATYRNICEEEEEEELMKNM